MKTPQKNKDQKCNFAYFLYFLLLSLHLSLPFNLCSTYKKIKEKRLLFFFCLMNFLIIPCNFALEL